MMAAEPSPSLSRDGDAGKVDDSLENEAGRTTEGTVAAGSSGLDEEELER